jgi:hypothetical protein
MAKATITKTQAAAMDAAFLARATRFIKRRGLQTNAKAMAALKALETETASLIRQQVG